MKQKKDQEAPAVTLLGKVRCRDTVQGAGHSYLAVTVGESDLARILEASAWLQRFPDSAGALVSFYLGWDLPGIRAQPLRTLTNKMIKGRNVVAAPGFDPAVVERDREAEKEDAEDPLGVEYMLMHVYKSSVGFEWVPAWMESGDWCEIDEIPISQIADKMDKAKRRRKKVRSEFQEYTVVLLFPKWAADGSLETYTVCLNAGSPREALARARESMRSAVETDGGDADGYTDADIEVVHVIEGWPQIVTSEALDQEAGDNQTGEPC